MTDITTYGAVRVQRSEQAVGVACHSSNEEAIVEDQAENALKDAEILNDIPDDAEELDLNHLQLTPQSLGVLSGMNLGRLTKLKRLCLRQNKLDALPHDVFESLTDLDDLDLYDNQLSEVSIASLSKNTALESLDLSFNNMHAIPDTGSLTKLEKLYLVQNKISHIENIPIGTHLTLLELGGNKLREIKNLQGCVALEELWLGKNKITKIEGLDALRNLRILSLQSNRLTQVENLESLLNLEELYLSHNGLQKIEGLSNNTKIHTLDISGNKIEVLENLSQLQALQEFWANDNLLTDIRQIESELGSMKELNTVYLEGNPCQKTAATTYRRKVAQMLPQLKQLDATMLRLQ